MVSSRATSDPGYKTFLLSALALLITVSGCSKPSPMSPPTEYSAAADAARDGVAAASGFGSGSFYPLAVGNAWSYSGGGILRLISGPGSYLDNYSYAFIESHRLIGTTHYEGTAYTVEEQVHREIPEGIYGPGTWWIPLRQDTQGLFSLDTFLQEPPVLDGDRVAADGTKSGAPHFYLAAFAARHSKGASIERFAARVERLREAARGIMRGAGTSSTASVSETQLLGYPLRPGQTWSARTDIPWPVTVNRVEQLETPAGRFQAYRLDINPGGNSVHEGEWVRVWYSRSGYLGYSIHTFVEQTDENGDPTGNTFVADDSMFVTSVHVVR